MTKKFQIRVENEKVVLSAGDVEVVVNSREPTDIQKGAELLVKEAAGFSAHEVILEAYRKLS